MRRRLISTVPGRSSLRPKRAIDVYKRQHIEERSELFASYAPAEVAKLEKAYAIQKGKYVVVCCLLYTSRCV